MHNLVVLGGGDHAKVVISIIKRKNNYKIVGYSDPVNRGDILGVKHLGNDNVLPQVKNESPSTVAVIGHGMLLIPDAQKRKYLFDLATSLEFKLPPITSLSAVINEDVKVGDALIVADGVVINSGCIIGEGVILNTSCSIDHDCKIGSFVHIAPGVTLSGGVDIGKNVLVGAGSVVKEYIAITDNVLIGAGSVVVRDVTEPGIYFGNPARLRS